MTLQRNRMRNKEYRKARNRVNINKLGVFPLIDKQNLFCIYLIHKKIRVLQAICDKILKIPRHFIHRKQKYLYIKLIEPYTNKWETYMMENQWKKL